MQRKISSNQIIIFNFVVRAFESNIFYILIPTPKIMINIEN